MPVLGHRTRGRKTFTYKSEFYFSNKAIREKLNLNIQHVQLDKKSFDLQ